MKIRNALSSSEVRVTMILAGIAECPSDRERPCAQLYVRLRQIVAPLLLAILALSSIPMKHAFGKREALGHDLALAYLGVQHVGEVRLKNVIDQHIDRVIEASDDNVSAAAKLLGMHRRSLQRHLRRRERESKRRR